MTSSCSANADEAAVMGAAFYRASFNPQLKMKAIKARDYNPYISTSARRTRGPSGTPSLGTARVAKDQFTLVPALGLSSESSSTAAVTATATATTPVDGAPEAVPSALKGDGDALMADAGQQEQAEGTAADIIDENPDTPVKAHSQPQPAELSTTAQTIEMEEKVDDAVHAGERVALPSGSASTTGPATAQAPVRSTTLDDGTTLTDCTPTADASYRPRPRRRASSNDSGPDSAGRCHSRHVPVDVGLRHRVRVVAARHGGLWSVCSFASSCCVCALTVTEYASGFAFDNSRNGYASSSSRPL
ncbi:hypothetical protein CF328_g3352 [Tilletia controversa]|nr:hypothetical protein CF328_g3352 [Tilletia controversa]